MRPSLTACLAFCIGCSIAFPTALSFLKIGPNNKVTVSQVKHETNGQVETKTSPKSLNHRHHGMNQHISPKPMPTPPSTQTRTPTPTPTATAGDSQVMTVSAPGLVRASEPSLMPMLATDSKPVPDPSPVAPTPYNTPTSTPAQTSALPLLNPPAHKIDPPKSQNKVKGNQGSDLQPETQKYLHLTIQNVGTENFWPVAIQLHVNGDSGLSLRESVKDNSMFGIEEALTPGSSTVFKISYGVKQVQVMPRKGCKDVNGHFMCEYGDCNGVQCKDGFVFTRGLVTRFEVGWCDSNNPFVAGSVAYDISNIDVDKDGRVGVLVQADNCPTKHCSREGCSIDQAWNLASDAGNNSPADTVCKTETLTVSFD